MRDEWRIDPAIRREYATRGADAAIAALAALQHGVVGRFQLRAIGLSPSAIQRRLDARRLHPDHEGVYTVGHPALTREGQLAAAVLAGGPGAVLSHASAAELWMLPFPKHRVIDVSVATRRERPGIRFHRPAFAPGEITVHKSIPVTTPERTILDLAARASTDRLERLIRQAEYEHLASTASLSSCFSTHERARGSKRLRKALDLSTETTGTTRRKLERRFLAFIRRNALPRPKLNHRIELPNRTVFADAAWPRHRLIVELDSRKAHANRQSFESDRARDRDLLVAGWTTTRVTWRQLHEDDAALAAAIRALAPD